jgi:ribonuclease VapC
VIVVDTSALLAIIFNEDDRDRYFQAIVGARRALISAGTVVEAATVYASVFQEGGSARVATDLARLNIEVAPMTTEQAWIAAEARFIFGKGRNGLNFGDCFSYALAKSMNLPLLFKGNDFIHTDVARVI